MTRPADVRRQRVDVAVVSSGHDVADARLHKIVRALLRRGLTVEVRGLGDVAQGPAGADVHTSPRGGMLRRGLRALHQSWRADAAVLVTLDPDAVPAAWLAARLRRRRLVVDVHEDYLRLLRDRSWSRGVVGAVAGLVVRVATGLAARADLTVVTDEHLPPRAARRRVVVRNVPDLGLMPAPGTPDRLPRAVYVGDLRESRGLFDMVEVVAAAPGWTLDLVGPVARADQDRLRERLECLDVAGRVRLHGRQPPDEAWRIARGAWVGLVMLHETPAFREAMPTKLYEYLASDLVVVTTRLPRQAEVIGDSGGGVVVDSTDEAAALLRKWSAEPSLLDGYREAARRWASPTGDPVPYDDMAAAIAELAGRSGTGLPRS